MPAGHSKCPAQQVKALRARLLIDKKHSAERAQPSPKGSFTTWISRALRLDFGLFRLDADKRG